jgi:iron(III) transport system substrate-binding protein
MGSSRTSRPRRVGVAWVALSLVLAVGAGVAAGTGSGATAAKPAEPKPLSAAAWRAVVTKAKAEGTVTFYSTHAPADLAKLAARFKELYGITVIINRKVDNDLLVQINAEMSTGRLVADMWDTTTKRFVLGALNNGWVADAVGPNFFKKRYDRKKLMVGKAWINGAAILSMAWNTRLYPQGVKDIPDFLNPAFDNGRLGMPDPRISSSVVDWYLWLEKTYGKGIIEKFAAMKPKIYGSALTAAQAVGAGEILGGPNAGGSVSAELKEKGGPIDSKLANKGNNWNAAFMGMILKQAPHPNAAQLLANFILTPEGQSLLNRGLGSAFPGVPGMNYAPPRVPRANDLSPAKVKTFIDYWSKLFLS